MASEMEGTPKETEGYQIKVAPLAYVKVLLASLQYSAKEGDTNPSEKIAGVFTGSRVGKELQIANFYYLRNLGDKNFDIANFPEILGQIEKLQLKLQKEKDSEEREVIGWVASINATDLTPSPIHLKTQYFLQTEVAENMIGTLFAPALLEESHGLAFFHLKGDHRYVTEFSPIVTYEYMLATIGDSEKIFDLLIDVNERFYDKDRKLLLPPLGGN
jgi:hypothetical protein